ncbi:MAG: nucleotidyltransferase [Gemmataceae bacterium]
MASSSKPLDPLRRALKDIVGWFKATKTLGMIIGGVAASLLGRARATRDVDALVWLAEEGWAHFLKEGEKAGLAPRIPDPLAFAFRSRVLLLKHTPTRTPVDISLAALDFERAALERSVSRRVFGIRIPLPTPEDLIVLKAIPLRPQDVVDIDFLLQTNPDLDLDQIRRHVQELSDMLETPEVYQRLDELLARAVKEGKKRRKKSS